MEGRLGLGQQLRQQQRLVMTPMLQQAIQLLQLSTLELQELLQKELTENAMLEETPPDEGPPPEPAADLALPETTPPDAPASPEATEAPPDLPFDLTEIMFGAPEERSLVQQEEQEESRFENFLGTTTSLSDHLHEQLRLSTAPPEVRRAAELIIGNLNDDGYASPALPFEIAVLLVQDFDPPGVGARSLRECLAIQLRRHRPDPVAVRIVEDCFGVIERHLDAIRQAFAGPRAATPGEPTLAGESTIGHAVGLVRDHFDLVFLQLDALARGSYADAAEVVDRDRQREGRKGKPRNGKPRHGGEADDPGEARRDRKRSPKDHEEALVRVGEALARIARLDTRPGRTFASAAALAQHLAGQITRAVADGQVPGADVAVAAGLIVAALDGDGYLRKTVEDLAREASFPVFEQALALVQNFDPPGVGARNARECLLIQLREQTAADPLAIQILEAHFEAFERGKYAEIARALKCDQERVLEAVDEIARLELKPGRRLAPVDTRYVVPDVHVYKTDDGYAIVLNDEGIPRLRINSYYRSMLGRAHGDDARRYVEDRLRSAIWLIKSVHQRQRTLYRVTDSIVKFQKAFLDRGLAYLRPLALRDVAEDIGMHESTVSRVTTNKYVETPQGLFELKYFFHSGIDSREGNRVSSLSVKKMIQDLVAQESPQRSLSDQEIARHLKQTGLTIARRTVAKYREELSILPSHQRRLATRKRPASS